MNLIDHIVKDTFDFKDRLEKTCTEDTQLCTWDIKAMYNNITHDLFLRSVEYWVLKFQHQLPLMARFTLEFVMEGLTIILKYNYVVINDIYFSQIKGIAMGAPAAVIGSNLVIAYLEVKMFTRLPDIYPLYFVDYFTRSYFRLLDDVFHKWLEQFNIEDFGKILNDLDPDLTFLLDQIATSVHYLDVQVSIEDNELKFDMYYKPTNAFTYLKFSSCHPSHTRNNIAGSLARRIIQIVSKESNRNNRLMELSNHLLQRSHPIENIDCSFSKVMQPHNQQREGNTICFTRTFNPNHCLDLNLFKSCIDNVKRPQVVKTFKNRSVLLTTRQAPNLKSLLTRAKFVMNPLPREPKKMGLYPCAKCKYCNLGYVKFTTNFSIISKNKRKITWTYTRYFSCDSRNVLYIVKCNHCQDKEVYLGKTDNVKQRIAKHASDVRIPENSTCKKCVCHLRKCSNLIEPYFSFYPFFYVEESGLRHFMERRFINQWKPSLNGQ